MANFVLAVASCGAFATQIYYSDLIERPVKTHFVNKQNTGTQKSDIVRNNWLKVWKVININNICRKNVFIAKRRISLAIVYISIVLFTKHNEGLLHYMANLHI